MQIICHAYEARDFSPEKFPIPVVELLFVHLLSAIAIKNYLMKSIWNLKSV